MSELNSGEQFLVNALADAIGRQRMLYAGMNGNTKRTKLWDEFGYPEKLTFDNFYRQYRRGSTGFAGLRPRLDWPRFMPMPTGKESALPSSCSSGRTARRPINMR